MGSVPDERTTEDTEMRPGQPRGRGEPAAGLFWLTSAAPAALAIISLVLSIYAIVEANREPAIWLSAPAVVRVTAGERAWFYVQPRFVSAARNDRVAIVSELRLEVASPDGGPPETFTWDEQGTWQYDTLNQVLTWIYVADPAPLVVGPSSPQLPICLFEGPPGWVWQTGTYRVTIVAARGEDADALQTAFTMVLPESDIERMTTRPRSWVAARTAPA